MKRIALLFTGILLCSIIIFAQSNRKSATGYFQSFEGGNTIGTYYLKVHGVERGFTWFGESSRMRNIFNNSKATKIGAEWRIVYEECDDESVCPRLVSATFTGRVRE